jgi:type VI secretion system secreted protein VgrG
MEVYRYDGPYTYQDLDEGERFTRLAMDALDAQAKQFEAESNVRHLQPGYSFELARHWEMDAGSQDDRTFLVLSIDHAAWNNLGTGGGSTSYHNGFTCIRKKIPFRPGRRTPRPCMRGLQSATVVGPSGEEIYCDAHGRIKVQFPWDREGAFNDQSSCWIRVASQWAGGRFGMVSLPRVGTEVLVDFLDGDPDLPIVVGAVYNATNMPPWELPASKTQSGIYTCSTPQGGYDNANTLRFEDKKGAEEVWLHAEKDQRIEVENNESHSVGNDRQKTIGHNETTQVGANRTETVGSNETISIGGNRTEQVTGNETIAITGFKTTTISQFKSETVTLASTEQVGLARNLMVGLAYTINVGAAMNTAVGLAQFEEVGLDQTVIVGQNQTTTIGANHTVTVAGNYTNNVTGVIKIETGKSLLQMSPDGTIKLSGLIIQIDGSTSVQVTGQHVDLN